MLESQLKLSLSFENVKFAQMKINGRHLYGTHSFRPFCLTFDEYVISGTMNTDRIIAPSDDWIYWFGNRKTRASKIRFSRLKSYTSNRMRISRNLAIFSVVFSILSIVSAENINIVDEYESNNGLYTIEGKVYAPEIFSSADTEWQRETSITINDGEFTGFLKDDGTFVISAVPTGSYVVEISNPDYYYESVSGCLSDSKPPMTKTWRINSMRNILSTASRGNQSEGQISGPQIELCATFTNSTSAISVEIEGIDTVQVFPDQRTVEGEWRATIPF